MAVVVLIGGGNASGKQTYSEKIRSKLLEQVPTLKIKEINLEEQYYTHELPLNPDAYDFKRLLQDIANFSEDIVILNGIYVLHNKQVRLAASLKMFIDCDNDTRLTRYIQKRSPKSNEELAKLISNHLLTRSDLIGRTESDIIIKTDLNDNAKNEISIELIINYLIGALNNNGVGVPDKGEINLRDNIDRFYELN